MVPSASLLVFAKLQVSTLQVGVNAATGGWLAAPAGLSSRTVASHVVGELNDQPHVGSTAVALDSTLYSASNCSGGELIWLLVMYVNPAGGVRPARPSDVIE